MTKALTLFQIRAAEDGYYLLLETKGGETFEVLASFEQLDLIAEEIDRRLDEDGDGHVFAFEDDE